MKVREQLQKKKNKLVAIIYPQIVLLFLVQMLGWRYFTLNDVISLTVLLIVALLVCVLLLYKKVLCPSCNFNFYHLSVRLRKANQINHCPGCGLELDSDLKT